jgi:hypothetical protein
MSDFPSVDASYFDGQEICTPKIRFDKALAPDGNGRKTAPGIPI